ncbi:aromatic ring-hydroxylating dioxygenase subunit alpha [Streptomyces luteoverticillatus]|uniref:Aromatic ring-hydroxylating dioxygenase subunit alpha n=1 Tax=Streptomyces luteoverticillatus TaxID=66425 RepID=A0A3S9PPY9_STRLT|nr:aromatic ring-hydroxylating dioxygenase subunit alpha [Streptomyces luteoverticillatus]AZQ74397.1 aromatic ring-hydroxylating dioxygenase subunit alpha [Streptomyces luteoverticillatus]
MTGPPGPPGFGTARGRRQKVLAAGLDPDHWYPVEYERALPPGQALATSFWDRPIVVWRGADGSLHALEDRCAHRQLRLSAGVVDGCHLTCEYHGWTYRGDGRVVHYAHDLFGRAEPEVKVRDYPVATRHGLIWVFPGDPALAGGRRIPGIPELTGPRPWPRMDISYVWRAHHSLIMDNTSDFTHAYLHRRYRPFWDAKLTRHATTDDGEGVEISYDAFIGGGRFVRHFVDRRRADTTSIDITYHYPYQCSDTGGYIKHWLFLLPMDRRTTRVFFLFYFKADGIQLPGTGLTMPYRLTAPLMRAVSALTARPTLSQDGRAVEGEQLGYERHFAAPSVELNPAVRLCQDLTIRKWGEHLARDAHARRQPGGRPRPEPGSGAPQGD